MSVEQTSIVDFIGTEKASSSVVLTISDHLDWSQEGQHLLLLQEKINCYLRFIEGGEIMEIYPDAQGKKVIIDVILKYPLSEGAEKFFEKAKAIVQEAGFDLEWRQLKV